MSRREWVCAHFKALGAPCEKREIGVEVKQCSRERVLLVGVKS